MITTSRNRFIGSHVTATVKRALIAEARRRAMSVSALIYQILRTALNVRDTER